MQLRNGRSVGSRRRERVETEVAVTSVVVKKDEREGREGAREELEVAIVDYVKACEEDVANTLWLSDAFKEYFGLLFVRQSPVEGGSRKVGVCGHTVVTDDARLKTTVRDKAAVVIR